MHVSQFASSPPKTAKWRTESGEVARECATGYARSGERLTPGGELTSRQPKRETGELAAVWMTEISGIYSYVEAQLRVGSKIYKIQKSLLTLMSIRVSL
jgi:hypothetical protein